MCKNARLGGRPPDHRGLNAGAVRAKRSLHLRGAHAVPRHVDHVVHAAGNGVVPALIAAAAIAGEVQALGERNAAVSSKSIYIEVPPRRQSRLAAYARSVDNT